jgi:hypothetical protein
MVAAFAVREVEQFGESMGELGEQTERMSKMLGITTEQVGELNYAAEMTGTDTGNLTMMMGRFEAGLAQAANGTGRMAEGLKALGLSAKELQGLGLDQQLDKIADAVSRFDDSASKLAAVSALGRGFAQMIPLLDQGSAGLQRMRQAADETNSVLDAGTTAALANMQHGFVNLGAAIKGDSVEAFKPFIDVVNGAVRMMTDLAEAFSNSIKNGGFFGQALTALAVAFKGVEAAVAITAAGLADLDAIGDGATRALVQSFLGLGKTISDVFIALGASIPAFFKALVTAGEEAVHAVEQQFVGLGTVIGDTLKLNFSGAKAAFDGMGSDLSASMSKIGGAFSGVFDFSAAETDARNSNAAVVDIFAKTKDQVLANAQTMKGELATIMGSVSGAEGPEQGGAQVPAMVAPDTAGIKAAAEAVNQAFESEVATANEAAKQIEETLNEELKTHKITMQQWLGQTDAALDAESLAVINAADKATASAALSSTQKEAIWQKESRDLAAIALEEQKAQDKAAEASAQAWKSAADQVAGAFNSQVSGLLRGTTTVAQAFKNMAASIIEDIIKFCVKWVAEQAAAVAMNVTGFGTVAAAQTAGVAAAKPGILAGITADVGQAFAGFSAFFAPTLGPAAPAAAAGLAAGVQATATGMAALDVGGYVNSTGVALIHAGEKVVPAAKVSKPYAGGGSGGGTTHIWHVTATDPQSFVAQLRNNSSDLARAVRDVFNSQPSLRPSY